MEDFGITRGTSLQLLLLPTNMVHSLLSSHFLQPLSSLDPSSPLLLPPSSSLSYQRARIRRQTRRSLSQSRSGFRSGGEGQEGSREEGDREEGTRSGREGAEAEGQGDEEVHVEFGSS